MGAGDGAAGSGSRHGRPVVGCGPWRVAVLERGGGYLAIGADRGMGHRARGAEPWRNRSARTRWPRGVTRTWCGLVACRWTWGAPSRAIKRLLSPIWPWAPAAIVSDPYRSAELQGVVAGRVGIIERARGGGESTSNVQALRALLLDSQAGVAEASRALLGSAFEQTALIVDSAGLTKVSKGPGKAKPRRCGGGPAAGCW